MEHNLELHFDRMERQHLKAIELQYGKSDSRTELEDKYLDIIRQRVQKASIWEARKVLCNKAIKSPSPFVEDTHPNPMNLLDATAIVCKANQELQKRDMMKALQKKSLFQSQTSLSHASTNSPFSVCSREISSPDFKANSGKYTPVLFATSSVTEDSALLSTESFTI